MSIALSPSYARGIASLSYYNTMLHCRGQVLEDSKDGKQPALKTCQILDFELEMVSPAQ